MPKARPDTPCALCGRLMPARLLTWHHLLPKSKGGRFEHTVPMCRPCHGHIHATFSNSELEKSYFTIAQLRSAPELAQFIRWIRKQDPQTGFRSARRHRHPEGARQHR